MISKKKFLEFISSLDDKALKVTKTFTPEELDKYRDKIVEKLEDLSEVIDVTNFDETLLKFAKKLGIIQLYTFGKKKVAKVNKWFQSLMKGLSEEDIDEFFKKFINPLKKIFESE